MSSEKYFFYFTLLFYLKLPTQHPAFLISSLIRGRKEVEKKIKEKRRKRERGENKRNKDEDKDI